jgi:hypothetical protein
MTKYHKYVCGFSRTTQYGSDAELDSDDTSRSVKKTLGSSPSVQAHAAIRIDGLAAILPEYPILICLICKTAVRQGKGIENRFRHTHHLKGQTLKSNNTFH